MSEQRDVEAKDITRENEVPEEDEFVFEDDGTLELLLGLDERVNDLVDKISTFEAAANDLKAVMEKLSAIDKKIDEVLKKLEKYPYPYPAKRGADETDDQTGQEEHETANSLEEIQKSLQRLADEVKSIKESPTVKGVKEGKEDEKESEVKRFISSEEYKKAAPTDKLRMLYDFLQRGGE